MLTGAHKAQRCRRVTSACERLRQEESELEVSLGHGIKPVSENPNPPSQSNATNPNKDASLP